MFLHKFPKFAVRIRRGCICALSANQSPISENLKDGGTACYSSKNTKKKKILKSKSSNFKKKDMYFEKVISLLGMYSKKIFGNAEKKRRINMLNITFFSKINKEIWESLKCLPIKKNL